MNFNTLIGLVFSFSSACLGEKVIVGYYVPWGKVPASALSYDKVTHINYGFGLLKDKAAPANISLDYYYDGAPLREIRDTSHQKGVKVLISLGGWTGSQTFPILAASEKLRAEFIENALVFLRQNTTGLSNPNPDGWGLDGLDLDWEHPGRKGAECMQHTAQDSDNYLLLLQELRAKMTKEFGEGKKLLTAAVRVQPFDDASGSPKKDVSAFAKVFDFINIMAYDIMGTWEKTTGPNAPFDFGEKGPKLSYTQSIKDWMAAGFPADKLTAGLAFYGRTQTTKQDMDGSTIYVENSGEKPKGDSMDSNEANAICNEGSNYSGVYRYRLLKEGPLATLSSETGFKRFFDNVTKTPYLYSKQTKTFISYDDPESLKIKVDYAIQQNLRGVMYWDMTHDSGDELLNVLQPIIKGQSSSGGQPSYQRPGNTPASKKPENASPSTKQPTTPPPGNSPPSVPSGEQTQQPTPGTQPNSPPSNQQPSTQPPGTKPPTPPTGETPPPQAPGARPNPPPSAGQPSSQPPGTNPPSSPMGDQSRYQNPGTPPNQSPQVQPSGQQPGAGNPMMPPQSPDPYSNPGYNSPQQLLLF